MAAQAAGADREALSGNSVRRARQGSQARSLTRNEYHSINARRKVRQRIGQITLLQATEGQ